MGMIKNSSSNFEVDWLLINVTVTSKKLLISSTKL